jgi:hypothetical protein
MEEKIKRCKEAGCENKISYKFRIGDAINELRFNSLKEFTSWMRSLFSDA